MKVGDSIVLFCSILIFRKSRKKVIIINIKNKKIIDVVSVFFCVLLFSIATIQAFAKTATNDVPVASPCYNYTQSTTASLSIQKGTATCSSTITGYPKLATKITTTMYLEKKFLWWWNQEASWTKTVNSYYNAMTKKQNVGNGTYRLRVEYKVYSNNSSETITGYSKEVTY